jgi:hypothetical protein
MFEGMLAAFIAVMILQLLGIVPSPRQDRQRYARELAIKDELEQQRRQLWRDFHEKDSE